MKISPSFRSSSAHTHASNPKAARLFSAAVLLAALMACRPASAQTLTLVTNPPPRGTFYSLTLLQAPFPFNPFPELAVYATGTGAYVYDDSQVDYVALRTEQNSLLSASSFGEGGAQMMSLQSPPLPGGGGGSGGGGGITSPPPYSVAGLKVTIPVVTNTDLYVTIFEHNPALPYDIYQKLNLNLTNWSLSATGVVSQTNYLIPNTFTNEVYFAAGLAADLVSHLGDRAQHAFAVDEDERCPWCLPERGSIESRPKRDASSRSSRTAPVSGPSCSG